MPTSATCTSTPAGRTTRYNLGVRATPDDAYLFAKGEAIRLNLTGELVKLNKPLDFMGVTEHAEYQGIMSKLQDPKSPLFNYPFAKRAEKQG